MAKEPDFYQDAAGEFRWRLVAQNGRILADSAEGYVTEEGAREGWGDVCRQVVAILETLQTP
jgi:hypothetical protein